MTHHCSPAHEYALNMMTEEKGPAGKALPLDDFVREHIRRVLAAYGGNISAAARALGMHRRTLQRKLRKDTTAAPSDRVSS